MAVVSSCSLQFVSVIFSFALQTSHGLVKPPYNPCKPFTASNCDEDMGSEASVSDFRIDSASGSGVVTLCEDFTASLKLTLPAQYPRNITSAVYDITAFSKTLNEKICENGDLLVNQNGQSGKGKCHFALCPDNCKFGIECHYFCTSEFENYIGKTTPVVNKFLTYRPHDQAKEWINGCYSGRVVFYADATRKTQIGCIKFDGVSVKLSTTSCPPYDE